MQSQPLSISPSQSSSIPFPQTSCTTPQVPHLLVTVVSTFPSQSVSAGGSPAATPSQLSGFGSVSPVQAPHFPALQNW